MVGGEGMKYYRVNSQIIRDMETAESITGYKMSPENIDTIRDIWRIAIVFVAMSYEPFNPWEGKS
jgi:hypothetical protein